MKRFAYIFILSICLVPTILQGQVNNESRSTNIYKDRVTDEFGKPLGGITISVKGKIQKTKTNANGEFSIAAKYGDVIVLSKDGKTIDSYTYDGSANYEVKDNSSIISAKRERKSPRGDLNANNSFLDSAKYYQERVPAKSIAFIEKSLILAKDTKNKVLLAESYEFLGDVNYGLKQYDIAVGNYELSLQENGSSDLRIKMALALLMDKQLEKSKVEFSALLKLNNLSTAQRVVIYEGIGDVYKYQGKTKEALAEYKTGLKLAKRLSTSDKVSDLNSKIANILEFKGETNKAELYYLNSQEVAEGESPRKVIVEQRKAADFYSRNNEVDKEVEQRKATLKNLEDAESDDIVFDEVIVTKQKAKLDLGNAYLKQNRLKDAIPLLEESANEAKAEDDIVTQKEAVEKLSAAYVSLGDEDKALSNYQRYVSLVDEVYKKKESEIAAVVELNKELSDRQNRINSLEKDRELSQSKYQLSRTQEALINENDRRQRFIIYALITGLVLLLFSLFWMIKSNRQRKLANNLLALKSLRTQMNPHFIFNALNSVNSFIAQNDERTANRYLTDFSTLMRSVLNNSEEDFISLEQEIELLELYLKLEHSRFEDKFDYTLEVDPQIDQGSFQIPPMLLQPYVENAVWHGLRYKKEKGNLTVAVRKIDRESIQIEIIDDGIGREQSKALKTEYQKKQKSKGMQNIKQRIEILNAMYKDKVDVSINNLSDDQTGTKVILTLKKD